MRTTINLDDDVSAAIEQLRKKANLGVSEAVNQLIRRGLNAQKKRKPFVQRTRSLGLRIDVNNVAEALELLEGPAAR
ncbi:MAG TPA: ribbon-helix-helix protein, CopG family [Vicinamibacteria bacterium]|nr:ribbon-helix-helix protein, CopG family [Vicinamibacteria bacterium]